MRRKQRFIKLVSRRLTQAGFECKITDNLFVVIKDGKPFDVQIWDVPGWGKRRVHFTLNIAFDSMDQVMPEALLWLSSECNNHSDYTMTRLLQDHFSCCVETTVRSAKEFVREFGFAFKQIEITYKGLVANYSKIKEEFKEQPAPRPIGFLADRYMEEVKELNECKLVAQTYTTFAAEKQ